MAVRPSSDEVLGVNSARSQGQMTSVIETTHQTNHYDNATSEVTDSNNIDANDGVTTNTTEDAIVYHEIGEVPQHTNANEILGNNADTSDSSRTDAVSEQMYSVPQKGRTCVVGEHDTNDDTSIVENDLYQL